MKKHLLFLPLCLLLIASCRDKEPVNTVPASDYQSGGATTTTGYYTQIFQQPASNLDAAGLRDHQTGDANFEAVYVTAPAAVQGGLGPVFNQSSCGTCHARNGRAVFPESSGDLGGLLLRLSIPGETAQGEPLGVPGFGGQLQTKAVWGKQPEAQVDVSFADSVVDFLDGSTASLRKPVFTLQDPYIPFPQNGLVSPRIAPPVIGLGLLEAIPDADILAHADENDANGDGISGRPNMVWDYTRLEKVIGRFGWKANQPTVYQQSAAAFNGDMGITSPLFPQESCTGQSQMDQQNDDPEIDAATLKSAAFYCQSLAVPAFRDLDDPQVQRGRQLFSDLQCASCHTPHYVTGVHPEYGFLSGQSIWPYTDLLLHDMGPGLSDNRPDNQASGQEWRTPPLWGIGLTQTVSGKTSFLHDGRARNLTEAILWHGGEAEKAKEKFRTASKEDREALLRFLNSL